LASIHIMVTRHSAFYSPLISAVTAGFLEEEGLEPTYAVATPGRGIPEGIAAGTVHVAQSAVSSSWGPLEQGRTPGLVHFAQINERDGFFIAGRTPDMQFTWRRLEGKTVLVDHLTQPLAMFRYAAHRMGVDYDAIDVVDAGDVDAIDRAFRAGRGDYVHQQGPAPQQLEKDGVGHVVASVGEAIGPVAFSSLCAAREWPETDMARAFMRAYRRARRYVNETPADVIAEGQAELFPGIDRDVLTGTVAFYQSLGCWNPDPRIRRETYEAALDVFEHAGLITRRHPYEAVVADPPDER